MNAPAAPLRHLLRRLLTAAVIAVACGLATHPNASAVSNAALSGAGNAALSGAGDTCQPPLGAQLQAATIHRATLVVTFGDSLPTKSYCIEFSADSISGLELLQRSGLPLVLSNAGSGLGAAVCAIAGVGSMDPSTYSTCFGDYPDYWAYYQWTGGTWRMSSLGASSTRVQDGSMEGWAWGNNAKPDSPLGVCPVPTPTAVATPPPPPPSPIPTGASAQRTPSPTATAPYETSPTRTAPSSGTTVAAPADAPPSATPRASSAGAGAPTSDVRGEERPPAASPTASATSAPDNPAAAASPGAQTGVIVSPSEGAANLAHSNDAPPAAGGRTLAGLFAFGGVVVALLAIAAVRIYRRRHSG